MSAINDQIEEFKRLEAARIEAEKAYTAANENLHGFLKSGVLNFDKDIRVDFNGSRLEFGSPYLDLEKVPAFIDWLTALISPKTPVGAASKRTSKKA